MSWPTGRVWMLYTCVKSIKAATAMSICLFNHRSPSPSYRYKATVRRSMSTNHINRRAGMIHINTQKAKQYMQNCRPTCCRSKVHCCIRVIGRATLQHWQRVSIGCEQDNVITEVMSGKVMEMCHVIMTTVDTPVTAILILYLFVTQTSQSKHL